MPTTESLDELIARKAVEFADQVKRAAAQADKELEELEAGSIFRHLNITNFLEGDLFAWYMADEFLAPTYLPSERRLRYSRRGLTSLAP